jgi:hypothetical protein
MRGNVVLPAFFGLTPECATLWAPAGKENKPTEAAKAATVSSITIRFILSSSF